jgi:hypothetical protein
LDDSVTRVAEQNALYNGVAGGVRGREDGQLPGFEQPIMGVVLEREEDPSPAGVVVLAGIKVGVPEMS